MDKILLLTESSIRNKLHKTDNDIPNSFKTEYLLLDNKIIIYYLPINKLQFNNYIVTNYPSYQELTNKYPSTINMFSSI